MRDARLTTHRLAVSGHKFQGELASNREPEARARFSIDVERVLSTPVSQMVQITPDFAPLAARCVVDAQVRTRLVERVKASLDAARARWTEHQDDTASKGLEARIFSDQLVGYGLVAFELGQSKEGLASIEEALKLAESGVLDSPQASKVKSYHEFVLKEMEASGAGKGQGAVPGSRGKKAMETERGRDSAAEAPGRKTFDTNGGIEEKR